MLQQLKQPAVLPKSRSRTWRQRKQLKQPTDLSKSRRSPQQQKDSRWRNGRTAVADGRLPPYTNLALSSPHPTLPHSDPSKPQHPK